MNQSLVCMCPLHPESRSRLHPHPILPDCHRALALGALHHASNLHWSSILHMVAKETQMQRTEVWTQWEKERVG